MSLDWRYVRSCCSVKAVHSLPAPQFPLLHAIELDSLHAYYYFPLFFAFHVVLSLALQLLTEKWAEN